MCFSLTASFSAGAILTIAGVASVKKVQSPSQLMFALIPIVFAIQQFIEGFVWLTLTNSNFEKWQDIPIYTFIFFAQVVWSTWVPLSFYLMEKNKNKKRILLVFVLIGSTISIYLMYCLLFYNVSAEISPFHVKYNLNFPIPYFMLMASCYFLIIVAPSLVSSVKRSSIIGILLFSSFLISKLFFKDYVISVWCFFAALISLTVFLIMREIKIRNYSRKIIPHILKSWKSARDE